jgi:hypothetical protein
MRPCADCGADSLGTLACEERIRSQTVDVKARLSCGQKVEISMSNPNQNPDQKPGQQQQQGGQKPGQQGGGQKAGQQQQNAKHSTEDLDPNKQGNENTEDSVGT